MKLQGIVTGYEDQITSWEVESMDIFNYLKRGRGEQRERGMGGEGQTEGKRKR